MGTINFAMHYTKTDFVIMVGRNIVFPLCLILNSGLIYGLLYFLISM